MIYEKDFQNLQLAEQTVLSLGKFDGLHRGHKLLIDSVLEKKRQGLKAAVFTFDIPPRSAGGAADSRVITTNQEKQQLFREQGIDYLIECPFTTEIMHMKAEQFIKEIALRLCVKWLIVGTDFRFGHNRRGSCQMLRDYAEIYGYSVRVVQKMQHGGRDISSTFIREELEKGNIELANKLLGYPYFIQGTVVHGNQLGREMGFPTINIRPPEEKLLPPFGVYVSEVDIDGQRYRGITNIGKKPTIHGANPAGAETYIYDFDKDVYEKEARVSILHYVRPEMKFADIKALRGRIQEDIQYGRIFLETGKKYADNRNPAESRRRQV